MVREAVGVRGDGDELGRAAEVEAAGEPREAPPRPAQAREVGVGAEGVLGPGDLGGYLVAERTGLHPARQAHEPVDGCSPSAFLRACACADGPADPRLGGAALGERGRVGALRLATGQVLERADGWERPGDLARAEVGQRRRRDDGVAEVGHRRHDAGGNGRERRVHAARVDGDGRPALAPQRTGPHDAQGHGGGAGRWGGRGHREAPRWGGVDGGTGRGGQPTDVGGGDLRLQTVSTGRLVPSGAPVRCGKGTRSTAELVLRTSFGRWQ